MYGTPPSFFLVLSLFNWPIYKICTAKIRTPKIEVFGWVVCSTYSIVLKNGMFFNFIDTKLGMSHMLKS